MTQLGCHWRHFREILICGLSFQYIEEIQDSLIKLDTISGILCGDLNTYVFFPKWEEFQRKV
jgi:hypothetical protein